MDAADWSIVLIKPINESPHPVIPELDHTAVKTRQDPWPLTMEAQSLHSIALRLKLRQHPLPPTLNPYHTKAFNITYQPSRSNLRWDAENMIQKSNKKRFKCRISQFSTTEDLDNYSVELNLSELQHILCYFFHISSNQ